MKRYGRYILRQLIGPFVFITLGLSAVVWLTQSLRFVDLIVNKGLSIQAFLQLTLLLLPVFFGVIAPVALFCAVLYVYNRLTRDSELVSLTASGLAPAQLARPALLLASLVALLIYSMTLYFMPAAQRSFKDQQFLIRSDYTGILLQEGVFTTLIPGVTVYVRARTPNGELMGILVHDERNPDESLTMMAERGQLVKAESGPRFVLSNGNRQQIDKAGGRLSLLYFDHYTMDLGVFAADATTRWREAGERYVWELLRPSDHPDDLKNRDKFLAEAHQRLVLPFFAPALVAIALGALLSGEFNRRGQWRRLMVAVIAGVLFEALGLGLQNATAKLPGLSLLMYLNPAAAIALGLLAMGRRRPLGLLPRPWRTAQP
jgi:lipopolysaccharide export system permease protein